MSLFCKKNKFTPLQRRALGLMSAALMLTVCMNFLTPDAANPLIDLFPFLSALVVQPGHAPIWQVAVVALLTLIPVLFAVFVAARYLMQEPDEFIRSMLMRALLWGMAITMAADAVLGTLTVAFNHPFPISLLNADVFVASSMISFRLVTWRYSR